LDYIHAPPFLFMGNIKEFRFDEWVRKAKEFTEGLSQQVAGKVESQATIEPPLSAAALDSLISKLGRPLPAMLRAFLERGSGGMDFSYHWTASGSQAVAIKSIYRVKEYVWGGGEFCKAAHFEQWLRDCKEWAAETWVAEYPDDLAFWTQSFPILRMDTADFLGLDCRTLKDDPAVVYLSHDDESKIIASSFTAFLAEWERLHYIGPDVSLLDAYYDGNSLLSADTDKGKILRGAFGDVV
jgi:hypothetical protein